MGQPHSSHLTQLKAFTHAHTNNWSWGFYLSEHFVHFLNGRGTKANKFDLKKKEGCPVIRKLGLQKIK
jgi:hypothetical protein